MNDLSKMRRKASDSNTPLTTLQAIAQDYPALRPAIALNPSTYPDLLNWLRDLGDPEVDLALEQRREKEEQERDEAWSVEEEDETLSETSASKISEPETSAPESPAPEAPADSDEPALTPVPAVETSNAVSAYEPGKALKPARPNSHFVKPKNPADSREEDSPSEAELAAAALLAAKEEANLTNTPSAGYNFLAAGRGSSAFSGTPGFSGTENPAPEPKKRNTWMWALLGAAALIVTAILTVGTLNRPQPAQTTAIPAENPAPSVTDDAKNATGNQKIATELPEGYTGPVKTIEVPGPNPGEKLLQVVPDPSASASAKTPSTTPSPEKTNPLAPSKDALQFSSFTTPDGNIRCIFGETSVQCFANSLNASTNCENRQGEDKGYSLILSNSHTLQAQCIAPVNTATQGFLSAKQSATAGNFACKNSQSGDTVMCWNTTSGDGFVLGTNTVQRFEVGATLPAFK